MFKSCLPHTGHSSDIYCDNNAPCVSPVNTASLAVFSSLDLLLEETIPDHGRLFDSYLI